MHLRTWGLLSLFVSILLLGSVHGDESVGDLDGDGLVGHGDLEILADHWLGGTGSAADLIKLAMVKLFAVLKEKELKSRIVLQVHDELVLEVPEEELEMIQPVVRQAMEGAWSLDVPLKVDMGHGPTWGAAH